MQSVPLAQPCRAGFLVSAFRFLGLRWFFGFFLMLGPLSFAAVPVEESAGEVVSAHEEQVRQPPPRVEAYGGVQPGLGEASAAGARGGIGMLFHQVQVLRQEVQALRGMLEEHGFQIERLARDQQEQYVDLDGRIMALRGGGGASSALGGGGASAGGADGAVPPASQPRRASPLGAGVDEVAAEHQAYNAALNLMRSREFGQSLEAFRRIISDYPNGRYTPNSYYWLGELHLATGELEAARQHFAQVVNLYPGHIKVPDALYKLGVAYHRLGDNERALEHLRLVQANHPGSSAAGLAQTYAAELE